MQDLISRQAAIDAINCDITITGRQNAELVAATIGAFVDRIKALPSAQPERILYTNMSDAELEKIIKDETDLSTVEVTEESFVISEL